jgi:hypothetical protein
MKRSLAAEKEAHLAYGIAGRRVVFEVCLCCSKRVLQRKTQFQVQLGQHLVKVLACHMNANETGLSLST